ncbi:MAG TPA: hypothetical protein VGQ42_15605 [Candidatus Dormibacteraeota bacterium]|jgi:hypothetical protein|nr:hypothetical protein [Candidatus Dormibacteraeota bacterium]
MALADFQYSYNGLTFGDGTSYEVVNATGLDSLPDVYSADQPRSRDHGDWRGDDFAGGRTLTFLVEVIGATDTLYRANVDALRAATVPQTSEMPLIFQLAGMSGNRRIYCRPRRRMPPTDLASRFRMAAAPLEFRATDPRIYDDTLQSFTIALAVATGGFSFPFTFPFTFGTGGTSGVQVVTNTGNFATRPVITITGPVDNPTIESVTAGKHLTFAITLANTDTLTIDTDARSVLLNGTASRRNTMTSDSTWFELPPGASTLSYHANTVQVGSTAIIAFRSAWL